MFKRKERKLLPSIETLTVQQVIDVWGLIKNESFDVYELVCKLTGCDYAEALEIVDGKLLPSDLTFISQIDTLFSIEKPKFISIDGRTVKVPGSTIEDLTIGQKSMINRIAIQNPPTDVLDILKKEPEKRTEQETIKLNAWNNLWIDHIVNVSGEIAAVVLQSEYYSEPFSSKKHDEFKELIKSLPAIEILPIAFFLLTSNGKSMRMKTELEKSLKKERVRLGIRNYKPFQNFTYYFGRVITFIKPRKRLKK